MERSPSELREVRLADLKAGTEGVGILARVVTAARREVTRRSDGGHRPVLSGLLSDGTATVRFTWWDPPREEVERGTVLRAAPVTVSEFRGRVEVAFSWKTRVQPAAEAELPKVSAEDLPSRTIADLRGQDEGFRLDVRVLRCAPKVVTVGAERREIHEGILADASGTIAFTAWTDFRLREEETVRLAGTYVREFRGRPQLVLDDRTTVERIPEGTLPKVTPWLAQDPRPLAILEAARGADLARARGVVVGLLPPSGLVYRCPDCRRAVQKGLCRVHGAVTGVPDLRARLVLDDGTAGATVNLDRAATEKLWGRALPEVLETLRGTPDPTVLEEELFEATFGRRLSVVGRSSVDDFGLTIYPEEVAEDAPEAGDRASTLRDRLGRTTP